MKNVQIINSVTDHSSIASNKEKNIIANLSVESDKLQKEEIFWEDPVKNDVLKWV